MAKSQKLQITQVRSKNSATKRQEDTLVSLGLRRMHQTVVRESNPVTLGMVEKVRHLVTVEEVKEAKRSKPKVESTEAEQTV